MSKSISSPSYTVKLFEDSKADDFINALEIYSEEIPSELRTSPNEIIHWLDSYSKKFDDELLIFGFYEGNKIIGFSQCLYFRKERFITIDYFVVSAKYRGHHTFQMIVALLKEFLKTYKYDYNFIVTEVAIENRSLQQLLKMNSFGEIHSKFFQPYLGVNNHDSLVEAKLLYFPADKDKTIKKETYKMIVKTIYHKHYIRWYNDFLSKNELKKYKKTINDLEKEIFDKLNTNINISGGKKSINDYSEFNVHKEIKQTTLILSIIFIFALMTLLLGKYFEMTLTQILTFVLINTSMYFLIYSLVSKKGIEQFKLLTKFFGKVK